MRLTIAIFVGSLLSLYGLSVTLPEALIVYSATKNFRLTVQPPNLDSRVALLSLSKQFFFAAADLEDQPATKRFWCEASLEKKDTNTGHYRLYWKRVLENPVKPTKAILAEDDTFCSVITLKDWESSATKNALVIYGPLGNTLTNYSVAQLLGDVLLPRPSKDESGNLLWLGKHTLSKDQKHLHVEIGEDKVVGEIEIEVLTGAMIKRSVAPNSDEKRQ